MYFKAVFSGFHGHLVKGNLRKVSKVFQRSFKGNPGKFLWCFKDVPKVFQWSILRGFKVFYECFMDVFRVF